MSAYTMAQLMLVPAALLVVAGSRRWMFVGLVAAACLDILVDGGLGNTVKHAGLTSIFAWRMGCRPERLLRMRAPSLLWSAFLLYVIAASIWSPDRGSAMVAVGSLGAVALLVCGLRRAWEVQLLDHATLAAGLTSALILGLLQTVGLGNAYGSFGRFTAFAQVQGYGFLLVVLGGATLATAPTSRRTVLWSALVGGALAWNGSRSNLLAASVGLLVWWIVSSVRSRTNLSVVALCFGLVMATGVFMFLQRVEVDTNSRMQAVAAIAQGESPSEVGGTIGFRSMMYRATVQDLVERPRWQQLSGTGTASGGQVVINHQIYGYGPDAHFDPNRTIHSGVLRLLYEFGLLGAALFAAVAASLVSRGVRRREALTLAGLAAMAVPLVVENTLVSGLAGYGLAFAMVVSHHYAQAPRLPARGSQRPACGGCDPRVV